MYKQKRTVPAAAISHKVPWSTDSRFMVTLFTQETVIPYKDPQPVERHLMPNENGLIELPTTSQKGADGEYMIGKIGYKSYLYSGNDKFGTPSVIAGAFNSGIQYSMNNPGEYVSFGDFSNNVGASPPGHSSHKKGSQFDWVIFTPSGVNIFNTSSKDPTRVQNFVNILYSNGFNNFLLPTVLNGVIKNPGNGQYPVQGNSYYTTNGDATWGFNAVHNNHGHAGMGTGK